MSAGSDGFAEKTDRQFYDMQKPLIRKITKNSGVLSVNVPKPLVESLHLEKGDYVTLSPTEGGFNVSLLKIGKEEKRAPAGEIGEPTAAAQSVNEHGVPQSGAGRAGADAP